MPNGHGRPDDGRDEGARLDEILALIRSYGEETALTFRRRFSASEALRNPEPLIARFEGAVKAVLEKGLPQFSAVQEAHNELCIAWALVQCRDPVFSEIHYEPPLEGTGKTIDFLASTASPERQVFVDVKTIRPIAEDRWKHFQSVVDKGLLPEKVTLALSEEALGGEIWHDIFTARGRMLEHTLGLERKIREAGLRADGATVVLALCSDGFHWHEDELEDFVRFYRTGSHGPGDAFSKMEIHDLKIHGHVLDGTIGQFAYMKRRQLDVDPRRLYWNVQPPAGPGRTTAPN